jgi:hypothetical protein
VPLQVDAVIPVEEVVDAGADHVLGHPVAYLHDTVAIKQILDGLTIPAASASLARLDVP